MAAHDESAELFDTIEQLVRKKVNAFVREQRENGMGMPEVAEFQNGNRTVRVNLDGLGQPTYIYVEIPTTPN